MDYEAIDRDMSSYVIACEYNGVRFYIGNNGLGTDMLTLARRYRWRDQAEVAVQEAQTDRAWIGFRWQVISVPAAKCY